MKYVNILLIGLVLLFPGCTFLDVVPEGNIESIESNFEKRDQTENWFKYCHFWVSPFTTSVISNPAYMGTDEVVAGTYLRESGFNWSGLYIADGLQRTFDPYCNMWRRDAVYNSIRYCNTFLEKVWGVYNMTDAEKKLWVAEIKALKAYYYFELAKRYGGVPLIDRVYADQKEANLPRGTFDEVVGLILREIEGVRNELVVDWRAENLEEKSGRITRGAALALKSRVLLYAASPQFNPSGEKSKWAAAAAAAFEVINMGIYSLHPDYGGLFVAETSTTSPETIWAVRMGATNEFERKNYPIGTQGGGTGICPSQNLVEAYESTGEDTGDAYAGLDPRFYATVLRNGDTWNGRTLEIYAGGADDPARQNASPTGYYLRKFLNENLNLTNDDKRLRSWIVFRYAEILLNFAEAMNEAYGPDDAHGYGMSARDAVDAVRAGSGVGMPPVDVAPGDAAAMRTAIKHERRIELAFEDHRYWDLRRWDDAGTVLNRPLRGVKVTRSGDGFAYTPFEVAKRIFEAPKMNLYPIPQAEIVKSGGVLDQNPGW